MNQNGTQDNIQHVIKESFTKNLFSFQDVKPKERKKSIQRLGGNYIQIWQNAV